MIRIAVCDDDYQVCQQLGEYIGKWSEGYEIKLEIFTSGRAFERALRDEYFDVIFLDVVLRDKSGMDIGCLIREELRNDTSQIIYISSYSGDHVMELFQFQPYEFLKKPLSEENFKRIFHKVCEKILGESDVFEFMSGRTIYRIPLKDIRYFEGDNRRVRIVTETDTYHCYSTLENLFGKINMEMHGFIRLHKSYAVNLKYVSTFTVRKVTLFQGEEFSVSTPFKENAHRCYEAYREKLQNGRGIFRRIKGLPEIEPDPER